ncbi:MAG: SRPBCC domain-containing protein [Leptospiraceae bacterium]|nr:SRPBCC domain-containing protein [Leptospiraceae bacterium]
MQKGTLDMQMEGDRFLRFKRFFEAPPQLVFDCLTRAELVQKWLSGPPPMEMVECAIEPEVGGAFRYVWSGPNGEHRFGMQGIFKELSAPHRIVHTEIFDEDWTGGETLCTTSLLPQENGTLMDLLVEYSTAEARAGAMQTGMKDGMSQSYDKMDKILEIRAG